MPLKAALMAIKDGNDLMKELPESQQAVATLVYNYANLEETYLYLRDVTYSELERMYEQNDANLFMARQDARTILALQSEIEELEGPQLAQASEECAARVAKLLMFLDRLKLVDDDPSDG